jgi:hypothetical protein
MRKIWSSTSWCASLTLDSYEGEGLNASDVARCSLVGLLVEEEFTVGVRVGIQKELMG